MKTKSGTSIDFALDLDFSEILTNPILDIAARCWADDRYEAFKICYRSMRIIDDLVDNQKSTGRILSPDEQNLFASMIDDWINSMRRRRPTDASQENLLDTMERFCLPLWPWEKLADAMTYDLYHTGFATFRTFRRYTEGAAIAPAAVFMHLCGMQAENGTCTPPVFDIRSAAKDLALFSYLVHIMRDFRKDQADSLNYFALDLMMQEGATLEDLQRAGRGDEIARPVRDLFARYRSLADWYRDAARRTLDRLLPSLEPRYRLSLELIYSLYLQIFERVNPEFGCFSKEELHPTPTEVQARITATIQAFESD